jgi:hypothetical protein
MTLAVALGIVGEAMRGASGTLIQLVQLISLVIATLLILIWVHRDSKDIGYRRPRLLDAGILAFPPIFFPAYLLLSRPRGQKLYALMGCIGFLFLLITLAATSGFLTSIFFALLD